MNVAIMSTAIKGIMCQAGDLIIKSCSDVDVDCYTKMDPTLCAMHVVEVEAQKSLLITRVS